MTILTAIRDGLSLVLGIAGVWALLFVINAWVMP